MNDPSPAPDQLAEGETVAADRPALRLKFYSHATLECKDIDFTRSFFRDFLGFETVRMARTSFWARLRGDTVIVVVQGKPAKDAMPFLNHNGLDVATDAEVDEAHAVVKRDAEKWRLGKVTTPRKLHGTYGFYFWDADDNSWEILSNPKGGYGWGFALGDQVGSGHMARDFQRPILDDEAQ